MKNEQLRDAIIKRLADFEYMNNKMDNIDVEVYKTALVYLRQQCNHDWGLVKRYYGGASYQCTKCSKIKTEREDCPD